jgi:hypothetical protein
MCWRADHDVETTDWRAVCGRTARTVRRAGRAKPFPTPIGKIEKQTFYETIEFMEFLGYYYAKLQSCHCEESFVCAQDKLRDVAIYHSEIASHSFAMTSINSIRLNAIWY